MRCDSIVDTSVMASSDVSSDVIAQGRISTQGLKTVILVNKTEKRKLVTLPFLASSENGRNTTYHVSIVDEKTHDGPWREHTSNQPTLFLNAFAVVVVQVMNAEQAEIL